MPRSKKGQKNDSRTGNTDSDGNLHRNELRWINIKLTDTDLDALDKSESTFEFLSASIVALAGDGIGVSIRAIDRGESYCVTLIGSDSEGDSISYGLSSFGGSIRDALLTAVYKFDTYLGGSFDGARHLDSAAQQKQRFR